MQRLAHRQAQRGVSLIEVLVAVLVLSIGLLGIAALQGKSMQMSSGALARSQATTLATDMLDRMRANRPAALNGDYNIAADAAAPAGTDIHEIDLREWKTLVDAYLPDGRGSVAVDGATAIATVTLSWAEPWDEDAVNGRNSIVMSSQL